MIALLERKPFVTLVMLLVANLLLLSVQVRNEEGRLLLRSYGLWLLTPAASSLHAVSTRVESVFDDYFLLRNAHVENEQLRQENARLKLELTRLREYENLVSRAQEYGLLKEQYDFETAVAAVIWKGAPFYSHRLLINAGAKDGVRKNAAIFTSQGVVGRALALTPFSAEVEMITNTGAAAGAMLESNRLQGIIRGTGSRLLQLEFIPNYERVEVGEPVYTSGTDRIYPKGLPIGRVVKSEKGDMIYRDIKVEPFADFSRLEEVLFVEG
ncbi:MAG: rod shape-determining protein MreC [Acidobacteriota bacterium]